MGEIKKLVPTVTKILPETIDCKPPVFAKLPGLPGRWARTDFIQILCLNWQLEFLHRRTKYNFIDIYIQRLFNGKSNCLGHGFRWNGNLIKIIEQSST